MIKPLTLFEFSSVLGSSFQVNIDSDRQLQLKLVEATKLGDRAAASSVRSEPFSLIFKGPRDVQLAQQICPLKHSTLGELSIFLVPVGCEEDGISYEAIFN